MRGTLLVGRSLCTSSSMVIWFYLLPIYVRYALSNGNLKLICLCFVEGKINRKINNGKLKSHKLRTYGRNNKKLFIRKNILFLPLAFQMLFTLLILLLHLKKRREGQRLCTSAIFVVEDLHVLLLICPLSSVFRSGSIHVV